MILTIYFIGLILSMMLFDSIYKRSERFIEEGYALGPIIRIIVMAILWPIILPIALFIFIGLFIIAIRHKP